ncbi:hypothetical protein [Bradyrhizobium vignae]|uniref:Uncharacterized protein n=1 Tax=Bradyrhizobium vignae TaxID=1549949 RepID=A0ABS4A781_9BRAD|nr:hypothetical protein [Bradyrhizobium vignae]MBP0116272.1 hypothetical protein [Bradyrhizobium vignae]
MKTPIMTLIALFCCSSAHALDIQITKGNCSPIINLNLSDPEALKRLFGESPSDLQNESRALESVEKMTQAISALLKCGDLLKVSPRRRLELLVVAMNQQIIIKEKFTLPALRRYISNPDSSNADALREMVRLTSRKIDATIERYIEFDYDKDAFEIDGVTWDMLDSVLNAKSALAARLNRPGVAEDLLEEQVRLTNELRRIRDALVQTKDKPTRSKR